VWKVLTSGLRNWSLKQDENWLDGMHLQNALLFIRGIIRFRRHVDVDGDHVGEGRSNTNGFPRCMALLFRRQHLGDAGSGVCHYGNFAAQRPAQGRRTRGHILLHRSLLFAFTVFTRTSTFAQYFIIWNANMPEETFHYVLREAGICGGFGMIIIFRYFFAPFCCLLRIDVKLNSG